jgi:hypothetical protein
MLQEVCLKCFWSDGYCTHIVHILSKLPSVFKMQEYHTYSSFVMMYNYITSTEHLIKNCQAISHTAQ